VAATGDDPTVVIDPKKKKKKEILIDKDGRKKEMKAYLKAYLERRAKREEIMKKNEMRRRMGL
jgi:argonaute-like protein implicated in RNA metabolism and viral defense